MFLPQSCLEKQILEKRNCNYTPDNYICLRDKNGDIKNQMLEANKMNELKKIVGKTKLERLRSHKSENPEVSSLLMSGWKGEEMNGPNMLR